MNLKFTNTLFLMALMGAAVPAQGMMRSAIQRLAMPARMGLVRSNMLTQKTVAKPVFASRFFSGNAVGPVNNFRNKLGARPLTPQELAEKNKALIAFLVGQPKSEGIPSLEKMLAAKKDNAEATQQLNEAIKQSRRADFLAQAKKVMTYHAAGKALREISVAILADTYLDKEEKTSLAHYVDLMAQGKDAERAVKDLEDLLSCLEKASKSADVYIGIYAFKAVDRKYHLGSYKVELLLAEEKLSEINQKIHDIAGEQAYKAFGEGLLQLEAPAQPQAPAQIEAPAQIAASAKVVDAEVVAVKKEG